MANPSKVDTKKVQKCYYCGNAIDDLEDLVIKKFPMKVKNGKTMQFNRKLHTECLMKYKEEYKDSELKSAENKDWDELYQYFRGEILGLPKTVPLQYHENMRLLGLRIGQYYPSGNNTRILPRGYPFKVILYTLKVLKPKLLNYISSGNFANNKHRIDGIMRFITGEINDVYKRVEAQKKSNTKLDEDLDKEDTSPSFDYKALLKAQKEKDKQSKDSGNKNMDTLFGGKR